MDSLCSDIYDLSAVGHENISQPRFSHAGTLGDSSMAILIYHKYAKEMQAHKPPSHVHRNWSVELMGAITSKRGYIAAQEGRAAIQRHSDQDLLVLMIWQLKAAYGARDAV